VRRLFLLRHAKSDWDDPALADHDRPLSGRGHRAGERLATYLRAERISPALVLCSSAARARATLSHLLPALGDGTTISVERRLYGATDDSLLARIRLVDDTVPSVMLVGHNPGIEDLAHALARGARGESDEDALTRLESKYPTAGLATLAVPDGHWRDLGPGRARLTGFVVPRDLEGGAYDPPA
jgi:phosphohistidine phosphatase